jgi:hypothetical protein
METLPSLEKLSHDRTVEQNLEEEEEESGYVWLGDVIGRSKIPCLG